MEIIRLPPTRSDGPPTVTLRRGGTIYCNSALVNSMTLPQRMRVEVDRARGELRLVPDPQGYKLAAWTGHHGGYLQLRRNTTLPWDGRRLPAVLTEDGAIVAPLEDR